MNTTVELSVCEHPLLNLLRCLKIDTPEEHPFAALLTTSALVHIRPA